MFHFIDFNRILALCNDWAYVQHQFFMHFISFMKLVLFTRRAKVPKNINFWRKRWFVELMISFELLPAVFQKIPTRFVQSGEMTDGTDEHIINTFVFLNLSDNRSKVPKKNIYKTKSLVFDEHLFRQNFIFSGICFLCKPTQIKMCLFIWEFHWKHYQIIWFK